MSKDQIKQIAVDGVKLIRNLLPELDGTDVRLEYSPESFSDTEIDYSLEVCEAVMEAWEPTEERPIILNLPATVEAATPNIYADQIEYFCRNLPGRDAAVISLHTHNDRGTGVAAAELGLMAGADRVEGCLFGNGERTGNCCLVTMALNMYTQGVDPQLDFSDIDRVIETVEYCKEKNIQITAYNSLGGNFEGKKAKQLDFVIELSQKYGRSAQQIMLRWALQKGVAIIPGTGNPKYMAEHLSVYEFELTDADVAHIDGFRKEIARQFITLTVDD